MSDSQGQFWSDDLNSLKIQYSLYLGEKADFAGILIVTILYGILVMLFFQCITALFDPFNRKREGIKWALVSFTVLMFSFATTLGGTGRPVESISYIGNGNHGFPGGEGVPPGPFGYALSSWAGGITVTSRLMSLLNNWSADGLLLYSCYIIYSAKLWIIALPSLIYLGSIGMGLLSIFLKGLGDRHRLYAVNVSVSLSLNILLTLMIVVRLVLHDRNTRPATGSPGGNSGFEAVIAGTLVESYAPPAVNMLLVIGLLFNDNPVANAFLALLLYKSIATTLVESCALFTVNSLLVVGFLFTDNPTANTFLAVLGEIQVTAPLLIIRRVANKSALTSNKFITEGISLAPGLYIGGRSQWESSDRRRHQENIPRPTGQGERCGNLA